MAHVVTITISTLHTHSKGLTGASEAPQLGSGSEGTGQPAEGTRLDDPPPSATSSVALSGHRRTPRWHNGQRRELLRAAMLLPHAAAGQLSRVGSKAASDSLLPTTECSLRSGCAVDERHGAGTHNSTLRGRGRASKLTWASLSVGQHSATAPAIVRARVYLSAASFATLLQDGRR